MSPYSERRWFRRWKRPAPVTVHVHGALTEADVRRIVRDELRRAAVTRPSQWAGSGRSPHA